MNKKRVRLDPFLIKAIAERRATGMTIKQIAEELGFNPISFSNWKKEARTLEKRVQGGENIFSDNLSAVRRKYQVNLLNLMGAIREAEKKYLLSVEEEFEKAISEVSKDENGKTD